MPEEERRDLEDRLVEYAARMIRFAEELPQTGAAIQASSQLPRSGTSPLAQYRKAESARSRGGSFAHNLKNALRELRESLRWLRLTQRMPEMEDQELLPPLIRETNDLIRVFTANIKTAKSAIRRPKKDA